MVLTLLAQGLELGGAGVLVVDEALGEGAVLDVLQDGLHVFLHLGGDDARAGDVVAVFRGVGDAPALLGDAALDHQVNDQLELVQHLEVGHLGLVAGLGEGLEAVHDQLRGAAAEDSLLAEEVGFGLFGEGGLDDAGAGAADGLGVGQGQFLGLAGRVLLDGDQVRHAAAGFELAAHDVARALGGDEGDVDVGRRLDVAVADVEAVAEEQGVAGLQVRGDVLGVDVALDLVRGEDHDQVGFGDGVGDVEDAQALGLGLGAGLGVFLQADADVNTGIAQAEGVGVALGAVTDDGDGAALDDRQVGVVVVEHFSHWGVSFEWILVVLSGEIRGGGAAGPACACLGGAQGPVAHGAGPAANGQGAGLHDFADAEGLQHRKQCRELVGVARGLNDHRLCGDVDH